MTTEVATGAMDTMTSLSCLFLPSASQFSFFCVRTTYIEHIYIKPFSLHTSRSLIYDRMLIFINKEFIEIAVTF